jgi:hypothetical protein
LAFEHISCTDFEHIEHFTSERILTEVEVEKNIFIPIPMVDRGKGDPRNLLAVVLSREEHG